MRETPAPGDNRFDASYYRHGCGRPYARDEAWLRFFGTIADRIVADIRPRRVLDAGCALGLLVETLRDRGVEAYGVDISPYAIANVYAPVRPFCRQASVADDLAEDFDLITAIEVVEHMPAGEAEAAIDSFCRHTRDILFSSSPVDHREPTHINVRPPEYWAEQFARHGFYRDLDYDASFITPWAARFRKRDEPFPHVVAHYERRYSQLAIELAHARQTIANMQRSWFWRLRLAYVRIRRLVQPGAS